jgi:hypothetical protein
MLPTRLALPELGSSAFVDVEIDPEGYRQLLGGLDSFEELQGGGSAAGGGAAAAASGSAGIDDVHMADALAVGDNSFAARVAALISKQREEMPSPGGYMSSPPAAAAAFASAPANASALPAAVSTFNGASSHPSRWSEAALAEISELVLRDPDTAKFLDQAFTHTVTVPPQQQQQHQRSTRAHSNSRERHPAKSTATIPSNVAAAFGATATRHNPSSEHLALQLPPHSPPRRTTRAASAARSPSPTAKRAASQQQHQQLTTPTRVASTAAARAKAAIAGTEPAGQVPPLAAPAALSRAPTEQAASPSDAEPAASAAASAATAAATADSDSALLLRMLSSSDSIEKLLARTHAAK